MRWIIPFLLFPLPALAELPLAITADLNGDGIPDRAELVRPDPGGDASLRIFVGTSGGGARLAVSSPALIWVGGIGQQPELSVTSHGSLMVHSMNEAIGRNRWHEVLTIAYRGGAFKIAGYTYSWYDTLNLQDQGTCDVNLLTGNGELQLGEERVKSTFRTAARATKVDDWRFEVLPDCRIGWRDP